LVVAATRFTVLAMVAALGIVFAATAIAFVALWPADRTVDPPPSLARPNTDTAEVVAIARERCRTPGQTDCRRVIFELTSGDEKGERASFSAGDQGSDVRVGLGDKIRVYENQLPDGAMLGGAGVDRYALADFERRSLFSG